MRKSRDPDLSYLSYKLCLLCNLWIVCSSALRSLTMLRRHFLARTGYGLGAFALAELLARAADPKPANPWRGILDKPHHAPKAKRVISLFMAGRPSQLDLLDQKPLPNRRNGPDLPESVRMGQRVTGMTAHQATLPMAGSIFRCAKHGESGATVSELMPWSAKLVDEMCFIKSMHTEHINHDPAITFCQTGHH